MKTIVYFCNPLFTNQNKQNDKENMDIVPDGCFLLAAIRPIRLAGPQPEMLDCDIDKRRDFARLRLALQFKQFFQILPHSPVLS